MSQTELSKRMGKTLKAVNEILSGTADVAITPETALQLEQALGLPARFWLKREQTYREARARLREREQHTSELDWLDSIPFNELRKRGYITAKRKDPDAMREALAFFRVSSVDGFQSFYSQTEVSYRMSDAFASEDAHLAAWLQCGEHAAAQLRCADYTASAFEAALPEIRKLTLASVEAIIDGMVTHCAAAGVAIAFIPEFPKTHVCGAARWIQGGRRPLIQLSLRHKTDDHFWFTFFHEACHILKHGKKPIYVDDKNPEGAKIEEEANRFARNLLIPEQDYQNFTLRYERFPPEVIQQFAKELGIAPGIVVGRLQHDALLNQKFGNQLKRKFEFEEGKMVELTSLSKR